MARQLGFTSTSTCYSHNVKQVIWKRVSFFRNALHSCFHPIRKPATVSLNNRGVFKASLPSPTGSDVVESKEYSSQYSLGILAAILLLLPESAEASALDVLQDIFKSKPGSLVHPFVMLGVLGTSLYTFYLGYQSRRIREADSETKKQLVKGRFGQRHYQTSAILLAVLTFFTFEGMANTFTRTGKLFPGPHLYAGLGSVTVMSIMASLAPFMQQGKNTARNIHFVLAFVVVGLIGSQLQSGYHILARLLGWE
ncbi:hypothetical protein Gasu2_24790 [Galdieria sulphuraria]|uniref:DUF4079 domain-containing protein n=1 Tax=Galdieria sulphuraria TaxID=130081 RepID=M2X3C2_GALSU|nr:uncharacterized protein Gasu_18980 [Galdieria sulphuraria]EME30885.1 hypothetical protein Gasu_18980 [Galdieria sulphuraria]GJD08173.1 hypothetical protein Gasu2_24790 [Galdieria sulphuraria]|eukprot:XP_005707405.1 hypothetical protein Gasu_18980 [Galdieria sulphuraria]